MFQYQFWRGYHWRCDPGARLGSNPISIGPVRLPWANYLTSFCLNVPFSKIGTVTTTMLTHKLLTGLSELIDNRTGLVTV